MKESIRKRIEAVRRGVVPEGYSIDRAMLFPNEWGEPVALNTVLTENKMRNEDLRFGKEDVLSVSGEQGVVNQISLLGRSYAGESVAPYHVVETGDVVYTKSPLKENPYGIIKQNRGVPGIVSTLYAVYHCDSPITGQYLENYFCIDTYLNNYLKPLVKRGAKNDMKVNNEEVLLGRIPLPPLQEQERINGIIAQFDRVIELKQQLLEEKRHQKQWLMRKLLDPNSGVRLPGFARSIWKACRLGDITDIYSGGTPDTEIEEFWNGDVLWCTPSDITNTGKYIERTEATISEAGLQKSSAVLLPVGAVLMCSRATIGPRTIAKVPITTNQGFKNFVCKENLDNEFLYYALDTVLPDLLKKAAGNTFKEVSKSDIANSVLWVPGLAEQKSIAHRLATADKEMDLIKQELSALREKKKALMQLLLTGLVRVNA